MRLPFPTTESARRSTYVLMRLHAPEVMQQIEELKRQWGGTLTYFKAGPLELGEPAPEGWQIDQRLLDRVAHANATLTPLQRERRRKEVLRARRARAIARSRSDDHREDRLLQRRGDVAGLGRDQHEGQDGDVPAQ